MGISLTIPATLAISILKEAIKNKKKKRELKKALLELADAIRAAYAE